MSLIARMAKDVVVDAGKLIAKNISKIIVGGGLVLVGGLAGCKLTNKRFKKEKKEIAKLAGIKCKNEALLRARRTFVDPFIAKVALTYCVARADGKISKKEKREIDNKIQTVVDEYKFPEKIQNEIYKIINDENINVESIIKYLNRVNLKALKEYLIELNDIAMIDGVTYQEQCVLIELEKYVKTREENGQLQHTCNMDEERDELDKYFYQLMPNSEVSEAIDRLFVGYDKVEKEFKELTKLNVKEVGLLMTATALQILRIFVVKKITKKEPANKGKKEKRIKDVQEGVLNKINKKEGKDEPTRYYAPLKEIVSITGVPFDTTKYEDKNLKLFSRDDSGIGVNHRFATLGHDPLAGLLFGTVNIMTNTITICHNKGFESYHVKYDDNLRNPAIQNVKASFTIALNKSIKRTKEDIEPFIAAFLKEVFHLLSDMYTTQGLQLPGTSLVFDRKVVEKITSYVSTGDIIKNATSFGLDILINAGIAALHGLMLVESNDSLENDLNKIKTKKIIDYSQIIAESSSLVTTAITNDIADLDLIGILILIRNLFKDERFIYGVKNEFIMRELYKQDIFKEA